MEPLLVMLDAIEAKIREVDKQLEELAAECYPETERLKQVPGVGPLTALTFILTLESPDRFLKARDVGPFLGLSPKRDQSGETDKQLRITKAGNSHMRWLLTFLDTNLLESKFRPSKIGERNWTVKEPAPA